MDGSWWRGLTEYGPLEKGMANHFSILALSTAWTVWKGKMIGYWKRNSPGRSVPNMLLELSGEITPILKVFIGRTDEAETHPDAGKDWGQEEKGTTEDEMGGWHHRLNGRGFGWTPGVGDGQGDLVCCSSWGCKESDTTEPLNWTDVWVTDRICCNYVSFYLVVRA